MINIINISNKTMYILFHYSILIKYGLVNKKWYCKRILIFIFSWLTSFSRPFQYFLIMAYWKLDLFWDLSSFFFSTLQFINQLLGVVPLSTPTEDKLALPADIRALQQHLCVVQLTRLLGLYHTMDKNQKLSAVRELMLRYQHGLEFGEQPFKMWSCSLIC